MDSTYLLELARGRSAADRRKLGEAISELLRDSVAELSEREQAHMFDILRRVIHDMEMDVRRTVSEHLAGLPEAPRDLCRTLTSDAIEVAFPILARSPVLRDEDLIEVIRERTLEHQLAVTIRGSLNEQVSDALVETGEEAVIRNLLNNHGARISRATMAFLVEESRRVDSFQEPILNRADLDPALAKRMYMWVSAALRHFILERHPFDHTEVDDLLERAALEQSDWRPPPARPETRAERLAAEILADPSIAPELLINSLKAGEVSLFLALFEKLTLLPAQIVRRLVLAPRGDGLAIACKALGLKADAYWSILALTRYSRPHLAAARPPDRDRVLARYEAMDAIEARRMLACWRRDADYLAAIRQIEPLENADG